MVSIPAAAAPRTCEIAFEAGRAELCVDSRVIVQNAHANCHTNSHANAHANAHAHKWDVLGHRG